MGILQPDIPVRRMANERKTKLTDALVRILCRFLTAAIVISPDLHDLHLRANLLALAGHGDGHNLTVTVALLLAILTGRSDLCIAGVFGAGKTRSLASLLIALCCEIDDSLQWSTPRRTSRRKPLPTKSATFQTAWLGRLRVTTTSSAAGATACIAVIIQTECGFLSGGRREASADDREDCYGRATVALTRAIQHTFIVSPLDMSGMIGWRRPGGVPLWVLYPQSWTDTVS